MTIMSTKKIIEAFSNPINIAAYLVTAFLIGLVIAYTYKKTHKGISYSQGFVSSLVMLLPVGTLIIHFVANNIARAIGIFGAFSIVRFRTAVKESKDMVYIFWILAMSLVIGSGAFLAAIVVTILISAMFFILYYVDFGNMANYDYLVVYHLDTTKDVNSSVSRALKKFVSSQEIVNIKSLKNKKELEVSLNVKLKKSVLPDQLINVLSGLKGIKDVNVIPSKQSIEF